MRHNLPMSTTPLRARQTNYLQARQIMGAARSTNKRHPSANTRVTKTVICAPISRGHWTPAFDCPDMLLRVARVVWPAVDFIVIYPVIAAL